MNSILDRQMHQISPSYRKCEACDGKGAHYYSYNLLKSEETEVTQGTWYCLPKTREEAEANREHYIRGGVDECEVCGGDGEVEYEEDYNPDYDDYYDR